MTRSPEGAVTSYDEWRVVGTFASAFNGNEGYEFTWSTARNPHLGDPERGARDFIESLRDVDRWADGPHLLRRTVTVTEWTQLETSQEKATKDE